MGQENVNSVVNVSYVYKHLHFFCLHLHVNIQKSKKFDTVSQMMDSTTLLTIVNGRQLWDAGHSKWGISRFLGGLSNIVEKEQTSGGWQKSLKSCKNFNQI